MLRIVLFAAGIVTLVAWYQPWQEPGWHSLIVDPDVFPYGLSWEWYLRLENVTLALGTIATVAALLRFRWIHGLAAVALAAGAIFLAPWILNPPLRIDYLWPAYAAVFAPAIGALAAAWLTLRGEATDAEPGRAPAPPGSPRPHSPTPPR
jgi:hypothetical protein